MDGPKMKNIDKINLVEPSSTTKIYLMIGVVVFTLLISMFAFKNGGPTCNNYVINVYLYLALSILLLGLLSLQIPWEKMGGGMILFSIILSFLFIILLAFTKFFQTSMNEVILSHLYWFFFILAISATFWFYLKLPIYKDYLASTILIVALIFTVMSGIVYLKPDFFKRTYGTAMGGLLAALIVVIIVELYSLFFTKNYINSRTYRLISYGVIVIFSLFVSYDTSRVFTLAEKCTNYPNYPKSSTDFFLDVLNLFVRIINLRSR